MTTAIIPVDTIPDQGQHIDATASHDGWLRDAMQHALHEQFLPDDDAHLTLFLSRTDMNVSLVGGIYLRMHATCDRCLEEFPLDQQIPIHMVMAPAGSFAAPNATADDDDEDAEGGSDDYHFGLYENRALDLDRILTEQIVLAQPMQSLCTPTCKGLCPTCGQDLNDNPCACPPVKAKGPLAALEKIRARS